MKVKTQSKKVNKSWLNNHVNDPWVKLANKEGYRARAAYKLKEIDEVFGLIRPGHLVLVADGVIVYRGPLATDAGLDLDAVRERCIAEWQALAARHVVTWAEPSHT